MAGSNPFRRSKSDDHRAQQRSSSSPPRSKSSEAPSTAIPVTNIQMPNGEVDAPHEPRVDDSASSDGQSVTDPFNLDSYSSDYDVGVEHVNHRRATLAPPTAADRNPKDTPTPGAAEAVKSDVLVHSLSPPHADSQTASSSSTNLSLNSAQVGPERPEVERETSDARTGNKEKKPPPPPRSHHGKLISPNSGITSLRQSSGSSANRLSSHGSMEPSGPVDRPTDPIRRSQSQYKRPPTPPLSRRQSQMRRSKTTSSKAHPIRLVGPGSVETKASPTLDSRSIASSRRGSESSAPKSEEAMQPNPAYEDPNNTEMSTSAQARTPAMKAAKRASYVNSLAASAPPPPPPRRVRGASNNSSDTTAKQEEFIPNPSNASDILADLSRLQKEVDDLRGHYEGRKVSH